MNCNLALKNRRKKSRERGKRNARLMCVKSTRKGINIRNTYFRERDQGPRSGFKFVFLALSFNRTALEKYTHLYEDTQGTIKHKHFRQRV